MRRLLTRFTAACLMLFMIGDAQAVTELSVSGQVRARSEWDKREFDSDAHTRQVTYLRTRLMIDALINSNTHAVVQFQDSRVMGSNNQFGSPQSGSLNDSKNVDIHQAYVRIDRLFWDRLTARIGRFEVNLGNQRVFGAVDWHNVGRAWEGTSLWFNFDGWRLDISGLKAIELNSTVDNRDFDLFGLTATFPSAGLELFGFWEHDAALFAIDTNNLDRYNLGGHFKDRFDQIDLELNGVLQFGDIGRRDISAFLFTVEAGLNLKGSGNVRLAAGIDYASGDDGSDATKNKAYSNLYYTGHKFRGYMDYFLSSDTTGLIDAYLRGKLDVAPGWTARVDIHLFKTAQDYTFNTFMPSTAITTSDVGIEIDLSLSTVRVAGVHLQGGLSVFLPEGKFAFSQGFSKKEAGLWAYSQATASF